MPEGILVNSQTSSKSGFSQLVKTSSTPPLKEFDNLSLLSSVLTTFARAKPPPTDHSDTYHRPSTKGTIDHRSEKPPTRLRLLSHRPEQQPTIDQITVVKPPTTDHITNMLYLLPDFSSIAILWYRVPHIMVQILICQVNPGLLKLTVLQS